MHANSCLATVRISRIFLVPSLDSVQDHQQNQTITVLQRPYLSIPYSLAGSLYILREGIKKFSL